MKILVCGGRDLKDRKGVFEALDMLNSKREIKGLVHGAARGADSLASEWAAERFITQYEYPADWDKLGKAAGIKRNMEMHDKECPDYVVAFPGGRGTQHMIDYAKSKGTKVIEFEKRI